MKIKAWVLTKLGNSFEVMLPAKRIVCPRCDGSGVHDHSAFSNGVEGLDDPDFAESYFRGDYDVRCEECHGENVILAVDEKALTEKMRARLYAQQSETYRHQAEVLAERRCGA